MAGRSGPCGLSALGRQGAPPRGCWRRCGRRPRRTNGGRAPSTGRLRCGPFARRGVEPQEVEGCPLGPGNPAARCVPVVSAATGALSTAAGLRELPAGGRAEAPVAMGTAAPAVGPAREAHDGEGRRRVGRLQQRRQWNGGWRGRRRRGLPFMQQERRNSTTLLVSVPARRVT